MRVFIIIFLLLCDIMICLAGNGTLNVNTYDPTTTETATIDRSKMMTIAEIIHEITTDTLREGVDNLLFNKKLRKALPYDDHLPVLEESKCGIDARFNLKVDGLKVSFTNRSKGDFTHTEWVFGDGTMSHLSDANHTYNKEGLYIFSVIVYDNNTGCLDFFSGKYYLFDHDAMLAKRVKK